MNTPEYINESMSRYIHLSKYSRWLPKLKRRETWEETCDRLIDFWRGRFGNILDESVFVELSTFLKERKAMPSMRTLMTAGPALDRDEAAGFNCWASAINRAIVFDELFYLLMCGGGVGFSVEEKYISKLPEVAEVFHDTTTVIKIRDSKIGWAKGLKELISLLYNGSVPKWDLSSVRPAGARLKTFGGRASGPEPLDKLFQRVVFIFKGAAGRRLTSLECHDIMCWIAMTVIVGSVRRSACISISDLSDNLMRKSKMGNWYFIDPQRALANNSAAYDGRPSVDVFNKEFLSMYTSKSGERGIVNKRALKEQAEKYGREHDGDYLLNPCAEAVIRDSGGCCK